MKRGDVLFRVLDGKLEQVVFVEESLAGSDCIVRTYVVRDACKHVRCAAEMYVGSEKEAWEKYLREVKCGVSEAERAVEDAEEELEIVREEVARVQVRLLNLGGEVRVKDVFTCPTCSSHKLEEVMEEVMQSSDVVSVALMDGGVACEYGDCSYEGGEVRQYRCGMCGCVIAENEAGLMEFLRQNQEE